MTDVLQIIANGLTTVPTHQLLDFILKYVEKEPVERIIVGHPKQMNNQRMVRDTGMLRRWQVRAPWKLGGQYTLTIPEGAITDVAGII